MPTAYISVGPGAKNGSYTESYLAEDKKDESKPPTRDNLTVLDWDPDLMSVVRRASNAGYDVVLPPALLTKLLK